MNEIKKSGVEETPRLGVRGGRDYSVDFLRCLSCFMVIMLHGSRMTLPYYGNDLVDAGSFEWYGIALYTAIFAAPTVLFVMVSGIFFLTPQRNVTPKKIWTKNVPKMTCAYIFWCLIYAIYRILQMDNCPEITLKFVVQQWLIQPTHLWYIPMIIGLYILAPFLRCITKVADQTLYKYGIILFIGAIFINTFDRIPELPYGGYLETVVGKTPVESLCQYGLWMVFGYYIYTYRPDEKTRKIIYVLGLVGIALAFIINVLIYNYTGISNCVAITGKFTITSFMKNVAIFVFMTNVLSGIKLTERGKKILGKVSNCTLMIYLVHWLFLEIFIDHNWLYSLGLNPLIVVWIYAIVIYAIGIAMALIFQLVPWKKLRKQIWGKITGNTESK